MIGQHVRGVQRVHLVQHSQPGRGCAAVTKDIRQGLVLHHISRNQRAVGIDKDQFVTLGVGSAKPKQPHGHAAQVDGRFLGKRHIGWDAILPGQQFLILRRAAAEHIDHLLPMLLHFLLLHRVADQNGPRGKPGLTRRVLGMKVRCGEKEFGVVGRKLGGDAGGSGSVFRAQPGIHHQGRPAAGNDGDVGGNP